MNTTNTTNIAARVIAVAVLAGAAALLMTREQDGPKLAPANIQSEAVKVAQRYSVECRDPVAAPTIYIEELDNKADIADQPTWSITIDDDTNHRFGVAHGMAHLLRTRETGTQRPIHDGDFYILESFLLGDTRACPLMRRR